ncbi:MAG: CPBP family intramembrane glutamic endopeptidase [Pyrinomonadaceae bacterium]
MEQIFFNPAGRLRSGWRVLLFVILLSLATAISGTIVGAIMVAGDFRHLDGQSDFLLTSLIALIPALLLSWLCGKWFEGLPFRSLGAAFTRSWAWHLMLGILFGAGSLTLTVLIASVAGDLSFELNHEASLHDIAVALAASFAIFAAGAAFEEVLFRGYIFQTLTRAGLAWLAILLTAVFFGAVHLGNPSSNWISTTDTIVAGVVFSAAYLKTRDLWFAFGIHLMWNWMQGSFFGIEVSGLTDLSSVSLFKEIDKGPVWLTGGIYGVEGGIASTAALLVTLAAICFLPFAEPEPEILEMSSRENPKASVS